MKKLITVFAILATILYASATAASASEGSEAVGDGVQRQYQDMAELFQYWEEYGYPNYVGGVFSTDQSMRQLTVLLAGDDGTGENQILASLIDASCLSFGTAKYSYNALLAVNDEISYTMLTDDNIYGTGVGWSSSRDGVHGFGESGKEFRVVVSVDESTLAEYNDKLHGLYGDTVVVEAGGPVVPMSEPSPEDDGPPRSNLLPLLILMTMLIGVVYLFLLFQKRKIR